MVSAESVKVKLQNLITKANDTTGKNDADLTAAINSLIEGFVREGGVDSYESSPVAEGE